MNSNRYEGQAPQNVINAIKQKHYSELDAVDFAFMKARQDMLTDADIAIYVKGEKPEDVIVETTPLTREERIINENRPLQDAEHAIRVAKDEAIAAERAATLPKTGKEKTEADKKNDEAREAKFEALEEEVETLKKAAKDDEKRVAAEKAKAEKEDARTVKVVKA